MYKKNWLGWLIVCLLAIVSIGCAVKKSAEGNREVNNLIQNFCDHFELEEHKLKKMFVDKEKQTITTPASGKIIGGYFLFLGGVSGTYTGDQTENVTVVQLAWETEDDLYILSKIPLDIVRIKIADEIAVPKIAFYLDRDQIFYDYNNRVYGALDDEKREYEIEKLQFSDYRNPDPIFKKYLKYVVITVNSEDWPEDIRLPLNK